MPRSVSAGLNILGVKGGPLNGREKTEDKSGLALAVRRTRYWAGYACTVMWRRICFFFCAMICFFFSAKGRQVTTRCVGNKTKETR